MYRNLSSNTINHKHATVRQMQVELATLQAQNNQLADLIAEHECKKIFLKELNIAIKKAKSYQPYAISASCVAVDSGLLASIIRLFLVSLVVFRTIAFTSLETFKNKNFN